MGKDRFVNCVLPRPLTKTGKRLIEGKHWALTRAASAMALSNSRYASLRWQVPWSCVTQRRRGPFQTQSGLSRPPFWPIPPTEYWPYSSQMLGPKTQRYIQDRKCPNVKTFVLKQNRRNEPTEKVLIRGERAQHHWQASQVTRLPTSTRRAYEASSVRPDCVNSTHQAVHVILRTGYQADLLKLKEPLTDFNENS